MKNDILIGSHVSMNGPEYFLGSVKEAISYNSNVFMFYTGAPQNSYRKPLNELKIEEGKELLTKNGIIPNKIVVHAPYIINPANGQNADIQQLSKKMILNELKRTHSFGSEILVLHPGSHVGLGLEVGIKTLAECLDYVLNNDNTNVKIAIETMAGKGNEICKNFDELQILFSLLINKDRVGVCLDTCHLSDAGYDLKEFDTLLDEFDRKIGLDKLLVIHLNDSKNPISSHKDRHENIGCGYIGFEVLYNIAHNKRTSHIPKILETPYINSKAPYKQEIEMLRNYTFIQNWRDKF